MAPMAREFVVGFKDFVQCNGVDLGTFKSDEYKDDRAQAYLQNWQGGEGVLFVGKTQKKAHVLYTPGLFNVRKM